MRHMLFVSLAIGYLSVHICQAAILRGYTDSTWGGDECNPCVPDVVWAVNTLRQYGDIMGFHMNGHTDVSQYDHWQGVQRLMGENSKHMIVTRGYSNPIPGFSECDPDEIPAFAVVKMDSRNEDGKRFRSNRLRRNVDVQFTAPPSSDGIVHYELIDSDYCHAGGIQTIGKWVAIPLEGSHSGANAKVVFYNLSNPIAPIKATYEVIAPDKNKNAGTASIAKLSDGRYLLVLGGNNARPLWFYVSSGTSLASNPDFREEDTWYEGEQESEIGDRNWGAYQSINIVNQCDGQLYLIGLHNDSPAATGNDFIDVWRLEVNANTYDVRLVKVAKRHVYSHWGGIPKQCNLDAAAGVYVDPDGRLIVYAMEHDNDGPISGDPRCTNGPDCSVKFMEFRNQHYPTSCGTIHDGWVELYDDHDCNDRSLMIDFPDRELETYNNLDDVEGFDNKTSSARWCMPVGFRCVLYEHDNYRGAVKHLYGAGFWRERNFDGFGDEASSIRFECEIDGQWVSVPDLTLSGAIYDGNGGPLNFTRSPYIVAGDISVPNGKVLTITSGVTLRINDGRKITANGEMQADGSGGTIRFVSSPDPSQGIKLDGQIRLKNGGSIKFP